MNTPLWYYARAGTTERAGPLSAGTLRDMLADGRLAPDDLVWRDGFAEWVGVGSVPEFQASRETSDMASPALRQWMTLAGILSIVAGIGGCLTLFGTTSGILMIIAGTALLGARSSLAGLTSADPALRPFFENLTRYLRAIAWALILGILGAVFFAFFYFGLFAGILTAIGQP